LYKNRNGRFFTQVTNVVKLFCKRRQLQLPVPPAEDWEQEIQEVELAGWEERTFGLQPYGMLWYTGTPLVYWCSSGPYDGARITQACSSSCSVLSFYPTLLKGT